MSINLEGDESIAIGLAAKLIGSWQEMSLELVDKYNLAMKVFFGTSRHIIAASKELLPVFLFQGFVLI
jgi:hypothetical protein